MVTKRTYKTAQFAWLDKARESDPKLQKLFQDLETSWKTYQHHRYELEYLYTAQLPKDPINEYPWL